MNLEIDYNSPDKLESLLKNNGFKIKLTGNYNSLKQSYEIKGRKIDNRLAIHPMEGADANLDGSPGTLTKRRYLRFAAGGAGLIWMEAIAVNKNGRANKKQLFLNDKTLASFKDLNKSIREEASKYNGNPYLVAQLNHAGRFGENKNIIFRDEYLDNASRLGNGFHNLKDSELDKIKGDYLKAARLAKKAGFDAVDIKSCHRYLLSELLAAHKRGGKYGGSYQNRTRFLKDVIRLIKKNVQIDLAVRLNIYDAIPYPNGWSTDSRGRENLSDSQRLLKELDQLGVEIINVTASTPYLKPHINRPFDRGKYNPPESPLNGVVRLMKFNRFTQKNFSGTVIGTGFSWFRQLAPDVIAAMVEKGWITMAGFGRLAFAYPDFARDIIKKEKLNPNKICITCSKCAELKAAGENSGCVIRDQEIYLSLYRSLIKNRKKSKQSPV